MHSVCFYVYVRVRESVCVSSHPAVLCVSNLVMDLCVDFAGMKR